MTYQQQLDKVMESYLNRYEKREPFIEFIISSACNQKCEYCYLVKHGKEMYPPEANKPENILRNFPILLEWLQKEGYQWKTFDIFSGEFFQLPFWEEILEDIASFCKKYNRVDNIISVPTNMSFLMDDEKTKKVLDWIDKLDKEYRIGLFLSASIDGPEDLEAVERTLRNGSKKDSVYYDKLFSFMRDTRTSAHPMVTRNFVKNYKENYDWWIDNIIKYDCKFSKESGLEVYGIPMFLEVRDPDQWDEESLEDYRKFLWYVAEKDLKSIHHGDQKEFAWHMIDDFSDGLINKADYNHIQPYIISLPTIQNKMPCSIQSGPIWRVGDLALVPCHRTCYPQNIYGKLRMNKEKTEIIGYQGLNPTLGIKIKTLNPNRSMLGCTYCKYKTFCAKGCLGSQYEHAKEIFAAQDEICKMYDVKYKTINEIAKEYGVYDFAFNSLEVPPTRKEFLRYAKSIIER